MKAHLVAMVVTWLMGVTALAPAAGTAARSELLIRGMHCPGCAMKVSRNLEKVANVLSAQVDSTRGAAAVVADDGKPVSPKELWEAVERAGYTPTRLATPEGTFVKKPLR